MSIVTITTQKSTYNVGGKVRGGYTTSPNSLIFLGLGVEVANSRIQENFRGNLIYNKTKNITTFVPSLGADYFVSKNLFVRGEASYSWGKKQTFVDQNNTTFKIKTSQLRFIVGGGYKF